MKSFEELRVLLRNHFEKEYKYFLGNGVLAGEMYVQPWLGTSKQNEDGNIKIQIEYEDLVKNILDGDSISSQIIFGDSGMGKTSMGLNLCQQIWGTSENRETPTRLLLPIYIYLPKYKGSLTQLFDVYFRESIIDFEAEDYEIVAEFKGSNLCFILDGYDEIRPSQNLYLLNGWNRHPYKDVKVIIMSRLENIPRNRSHLFNMDTNVATTTSYKEYHLVPFNSKQIETYIDKFARFIETHELEVLEGTQWELIKIDLINSGKWDSKKYKKWFKILPDFKKLAGTPFILSLILQFLPGMAAGLPSTGPETMTTAQRLCSTKSGIYDKFINAWFSFQVNKIQDSFPFLAEKISSDQLKSYLFAYAQNLAQTRVNTVDGMLRDEAFQISKTINIRFAEPMNDNDLLDLFHKTHRGILNEPDILEKIRNACLVQFTETEFRFFHPSILEYFLARDLSEGLQGTFEYFLNQTEAVDHSIKQMRLGLTQNVLENTAVLSQLAQRAQTNDGFSSLLFDIIERSKDLPLLARLSANSITILNVAGFSFSGKDFRHAQFPGANLNHSICGNTDFRGANLKDATFYAAWLTQAKFQGANFADIYFAESVELKNECRVYRVKFWNQFLLSGTKDPNGYVVTKWNIQTGKIEHRLDAGKPIQGYQSDFAVIGNYIAVWKENIRIYKLKNFKLTTTIEIPWSGLPPSGRFRTYVQFHTTGRWVNTIIMGHEITEGQRGTVIQIHEFNLNSRSPQKCEVSECLARHVKKYDYKLVMQFMIPQDMSWHPAYLGNSEYFLISISNNYGEVVSKQESRNGVTSVSYELVSHCPEKAGYDNIGIYNIKTYTLCEFVLEPDFHISRSTDFHNGLLVVGGSQYGRIKVFDIICNNLVKSFIGHSSKIDVLKFNSDATILASASHDLELKLWSSSTNWSILRVYTQFQFLILSIEFAMPFSRANGSRDVEFMVVVPKLSENVRIYNVSGGKDNDLHTNNNISSITTQKNVTYCVSHYSISKDGDLLANFVLATPNGVVDVEETKSDQETRSIQIFEIKSGIKMYDFEVEVGTSFSKIHLMRNNKLLLFHGDTCQIFDFTGLIIKEYQMPSPVEFIPDRLFFMSPTRKLFARSVKYGRVVISDISETFDFSRRFLFNIGDAGDIKSREVVMLSGCFDSSEQQFGCSTTNDQIKIWNIKNGNLTTTISHSRNDVIQFCLNQYMLLSCNNTHLFLHELKSSSTVKPKEYEFGHPFMMNYADSYGFEIAYDPIYNLIATNGFNRRCLQIRTLEFNEEIHKLEVWFDIGMMEFVSFPQKSQSNKTKLIAASKSPFNLRTNVVCFDITLQFTSCPTPKISSLEWVVSWCHVSDLNFCVFGANITQTINLSFENQLILQLNGAFGKKAPARQTYTSKGNIFLGIMGTASLNPVSPIIEISEQNYPRILISESEWVLTIVLENVDLDDPMRLPGRQKRRHVFMLLEGLFNKRRFIVRTELYATKKRQGFYTLVPFINFEDFQRSMGKYRANSEHGNVLPAARRLDAFSNLFR